MQEDIYLLDNLLKPETWDQLSPKELDNIKEYLRDMRTAPGDGEMDIEWQETCRGYYVHLEIANTRRQESESALSQYLALLEKDIAAWLILKPNHIVVLAVKNWLFPNNTE